MGTGNWKIARSPGHRSPARRRLPTLVITLTASLVAGYAVFGVSGGAAVPQGAGQASSVSGMARLSGTVEAAKPFKAAQVYIRNVDKRILYMVYTQAGAFRAVALFPGNYEVRVQAKGLESEIQKLFLKPGDNPKLTLSMKNANPAPVRVPSVVADESRGREGSEGGLLTLQSYDEIYPPGPGKEVAEQVCIICHGENFLPARPASEGVWNARIDYMMGKALWEHDKRGLVEGVLAPPTSMWRFGKQDRQDLVAYLVKNFGPGAKPRAVRTDREMPLDEAKLGKAMYIEYYLTPDPPGQGTKAPEYKSSRRGYTVGFDRDGNVWLVDRGFPNRLARLDPRTGEQRDFLFPEGETKNGNHEILVDPDGTIWLPQWTGMQSSKDKKLLGFDPKTQKWIHKIPMDPDDVIRSSVKGMHSLAMDSKGNIYVGWFLGGALGKWDRATGKVSVFKIPIPNAVPYGVTIDKNDNVFIALWSGNGLAKFDTTINAWTIFSPPTYPAHYRRPNADSNNNIWSVIWAAGKRPGKLVKLDQTTGRMTEWSIPHQNAQPYDVNEDPEGNIWFPDYPMPDRGAALGRFNPRDETFTFYPKPQVAETSPKTQITREGAVWYSPRGELAPGFGVLYPDMDKITDLGAYFRNGPPGYHWKVTPPPTAPKPTASR